MTDSKPIKSLREMAENTAKREGQLGIRCPNCHCVDTRVQTTRRADGMVVRYRVCRHCGKHKTTIET